MISFLSAVPKGNCARTWVFTIRKREMNSEMTKFAGDMILFRVLKMKANWKKHWRMQDAEWLLIKWKMKFIVDKGKVMYMGKKTLHKHWWSWLVITTQKQDLGVIIDSSMKMSAQCSVAIKKLNWMLGIIKRRIEKKKQKIELYKCCKKSMMCSIFNSMCNSILSISEQDMVELKTYKKEGMDNH